MAALALLLILLGALGSALIAFRSGDRISVLVAADDIPIGKTVERSDFVETSVAADAKHLITADSEQFYVGSRATVGVPAGTLVNRDMFTKTSIVPNGATLVGVVVSPAQRTSSLPRPGDVVRLFYVSGSGQQASGSGALAPGEKVVDAARVVYTGSGQGSDSRNVTVLVNVDAAGDVAEYASSGHLAMTILPSGTTPRPDLQKVQ